MLLTVAKKFEITSPADGYQKAGLEPSLRLTENMEFIIVQLLELP